MLACRIGADDEKVGCSFQFTMAGTSRQERDVAGTNLDLMTVFAAQDQRCVSGCEAEHFMGSRVIVMEAVNSISPLRRPLVPLEQSFEGADAGSV